MGDRHNLSPQHQNMYNTMIQNDEKNKRIIDDFQTKLREKERTLRLIEQKINDTEEKEKAKQEKIESEKGKQLTKLMDLMEENHKLQRDLKESLNIINMYEQKKKENNTRCILKR